MPRPQDAASPGGSRSAWKPDFAVHRASVSPRLPTSPAQASGPERRPDVRNAIAITCFFLSGFAGLVYEVCWIRTASLVFGSTIFAVGTVHVHREITRHRLVITEVPIGKTPHHHLS